MVAELWLVISTLDLRFAAGVPLIDRGGASIVALLDLIARSHLINSLGPMVW